MRLKQLRERLAECGVSRTFEEGLCKAACLDLALINDPAGRKESNLWKLILKAREIEQQGGLSLLNLMGDDSGSDLLDVTEGDATSAQEPNSINLMTVHGSKGLQFDHVIIPQVGKRPLSPRTAVLSHLGDKFFFPIFTNDEDEDSGLTSFSASPLDNQMVRDRFEREQREFNRLLYVAVTRAKETLTLSFSEVARDSWAARSPMFSQEAGVYKKSHYIYEVIESSPSSMSFNREAVDKKSTRPRWATHRVNHDHHRAVMDLLTGKVSVGQGPTDYLRRWKAQTLGTRVHRALEALKYGHQPGEEDESAISYVLSLQSPPLEALIREGEVEWGFQVATPTQTVEGQIDLWGKVDGQIHIVDYKSGSPKGRDQAFEQLSLYSWALRKFGHREPIVMSVVFPLAQQVISEKFNESLFSRWK